MKTALVKAIALITSGNAELINILQTTARMSFSSSIIALIIGLPFGILYGAARFKGRGTLIVINRTLMGVPPVVCGLLFYILFSGVGPFRHLHLMYTVRLMVLAQIALITPTVIGNMHSFTESIAAPVLESARGLGLGKWKTFTLLLNESLNQIIFVYLMSFSRAIAEVGAVSMVGGSIAWKTNVMTTSIMEYTNKGDFTLGIALGIILLAISLIINCVITLLQRRIES